MAKKRVHELAKQYDMPQAEVLKRLNAYGLKVKAAASAVDETEAERALTGKAPREATNGKPAAKPRPPQQTGMGFDRPATESARQRLEERQRAQQEAAQRAKDAKAKPKAKPQPQPQAEGDGQAGGERRPPRCRASARPARPAACAAW
jgi:translation initiation factor IF-2